MPPITLPEDVRFIMETLRANGYEAYAVGGCVRDSLMGVTPKDWDIATSAKPMETKSLFPHTFDTGLQHGTVTVVRRRVNYEVTTFRTDGVYADSRRPLCVTFSDGIGDDLSRRDFTMNAIAYSPQEGFVDPYGGRGDILAKTIRCVGEPAHRFTEDALRMLRALRFAAQLGFGIEGETWEALCRLKGRLTLISAERVRGELTRLLFSVHIDKIQLLEQAGLLPLVMMGGGYKGNIFDTVEQFRQYPNTPEIRLALFFAWAGGDANALMRGLRFDNKTIKTVCAVIKLLPERVPHDKYPLKKYMNRYSPEILRHVMVLQKAREAREAMESILDGGECYSLNGLAVNGGDLLEAGIPPGREMGELLNKLLDEAMRRPESNEKHILLALAKGSV
jgi:tRNA nucleotidyltransferase (CCA-adding enzyme)